jgi:Arc/MetJ-type ribon-helix-helix transcriptional regulator
MVRYHDKLANVVCNGGECAVTYQFPADVEQLIKQRMALGIYASEDELLRDALGALEQREQERLARWDERNRLAVEQSKRGLSRPLYDENVLARLRERLANEGIRQ